ncbi:hypothetical protein KEJ18_06840 [Candidatus Bathyarchaeota archaeon]|nr:hypothetical protein [Candidatus Bathyarchaeota archaeon]
MIGALNEAGKLFKKEAAIVMFLFSLVVLFLVFSSFAVFNVHAQQEYTYYGYVPAKMWRYNLTDQDDPNSGYYSMPTSVSSAGLVAVLAMHDNTYVEVYSLDNGSLVSEATIDSLEKHYTVFRNGSFFKVVTNQLACVYLLNYGSIPLSNATAAPFPDTFYQDVNGAYVGKEFYVLGLGNDYSIGYAVIALEKSDVTVTREDGQEQHFSLDANAWKELLLYPFKAFKIKSTGYIMVQSGRPVDIWGNARTFYVPSAYGGFVGTAFYSWATTSWDWTENYGFRVSSVEDASVTVWSLETKEKLLTANVPGGGGLGFKPLAPAIFVQSDKPVTLAYFHNGSIESSVGNEGIFGAYGSGVGYFGVRPGEETPFFLSIDSYVEAYIFASEDTEITVDGDVYSIDADSYYVITTPGSHVISSNKNVVVETLNWPNTPEYQGLIYNGVQIPAVQTVDITVNVSLTSLGGFPILYVIIGAAVVVVGVAIGLVIIRGRGKK